MSTVTPLVGIPACRKFIDPHPFHAAGEKYVCAVSVAARAMPVLIPPLGRGLDVDWLLERVDGLLLTGSPSNVESHHYGGPPSPPETLHDPHRDATTLPMIRRAVQAGVPLLAICRGCQEMNVAFGGTLHQNVHELPGMLDHREDAVRALEEQYDSVHGLRVTPRGVLARIVRSSEMEVNSLHAQGIDRLGQGLVVEAIAPDGLVEAFSVADAPAFALAVQWHPEWQAMRNPFSRALFASFGDACRARAAGRRLHELDSAVV